MGEKIVIVGAGIIGLYTGYLLCQQGRGQDLVFIAEYLPGDQSINYTSPWAGGNFSCISSDSPKALRHDKLSFINLRKIHDLYGPQAGLAMLRTEEYWETQLPSDAKIESLKSYIPDLRIVPKNELPGKALFGVTYTTFNFNSPMFLKFLAKYVSQQGATFIRRKLDHIGQAFEYATPSSPLSPTVIFNCTGIGAQTLGGVADTDVYPTRGQVVVIRAPHINENRAIWSPYSATYIIPRPYSFVDTQAEGSVGSTVSGSTGKTGNVGHIVLGGFLQQGNYSGDTYGHETFNILDRATALYPELLRDPITGKNKTIHELEIVREAAGLRPSRKGGVRIETERLDEDKYIVHNYGAGGTGYQSGLGMAIESVGLFNEIGSKGKL
ncbi:uncharacterized protein SAPINGB_P004388 [Magnusiomyces paraingens]|uniref:FAD dependent oxidoreductase domain-containing protein n=1 Tax=Magnusiomyces paraingens TaxID=2606893 RepID=A0A5E8C1N3_9ASCO|nr:uncharacterized protein SAPINGB_P004388 [Saprochaete ingens]VVT55035.1 unnamed protein product [Saprochaete ingens]